MIDPALLDLMADPLTHQPLQLDGDQLLNPVSQRVYPIRGRGIPSFVSASSVTFRHRFWRSFYDRTAFAYDTVLNLGHRLQVGSELSIRPELLKHLDLPVGASILDIGAGTAAIRPHLPQKAAYVGLDASLGMLHRARRLLTKADLQGHLVHADALSLPFKPKRFNLVICIGVLQHLSNPGLAVNEMLRVARQASRILLLDEISSLPQTLKRVAKKSARSPLASPPLDALAAILFPEAHPFSVITRTLGDYFLIEAAQTTSPPNNNSVKSVRAQT